MGVRQRRRQGTALRLRAGSDGAGSGMHTRHLI
jgi:hypothetical protein